MKLLFENWRKYLLAEKLMLKPGPNGWDLYGKLVSDAYQDAPPTDDAAVGHWEELEEWIPKMFKRIMGVVEVQFVDEDPYENDEDLRSQVKETGVLKVWRGGTSHPVWSPENNLKFRAIHDWMAHIQPKGKPGFGMRGEIAAYNAHLHTVPESARPALFTEVIGQAAVFINTRKFPEQKIAIIPGFDFDNVGVVDGYDIIDKELVKAEEEDLYHGTSTVFQKQVAQEGIQSPSVWGNYQLAENHATFAAKEYGGDPMIIQIPKSQFNQSMFSANESIENYVIYNEDMKIGMKETKRDIL